MAHRYVVEVLDHNEYPAEELELYINEMSGLEKLRLVAAFPNAHQQLTLIWEVL
ncbi:MAG TPA: hypothetical protein VNO81_03705 [Candidatus Nitrosotenuis sp.]|jgi:hypothetical protein|nr:hypothetical protein [Candidatus Nitrosotenuis sp.]